MTISDPKIAIMVNLKFFLFLSLTTTFFSCKREDVDVVGPELTIASSDFKILNAFDASVNNVNFALDSAWFTAAFSEKVSWTITIRGKTSKAIKEITGTSDFLNKSNTIWSGAHTGLNFFISGEEAEAELSIFGKNEKWVLPLTIINQKNNYGSNAIIYWDMDQLGVARNGWPYVYWFEHFDQNEKVLGFLDSPSGYNNNDPIQGAYRSHEGKELIIPNDYYIGGMSHVFSSYPIGFSAPLEELYLNFYLRRRTPTTGVGFELTSLNVGDTSKIHYNLGPITWEGWKLVSVKMSTMTKDSKYTYPFDPSYIRQFAANLQTTTGGKDETGFDIDFIVFTKGAPFNPAAHK